MSKVKSYEEAVALFADGQTLMIGGFLATGTPESLIEGLVIKGNNKLTIIANDTAFPDRGVGKLIVNKQAAKVIVSHIGTNPETGRQFNQQELEVEFSPQGTLAERIRCGGSGLGGVLTPTGVGTVVEQGKDKVVRGDKTYLLELPLRADIALIKAWRADTCGNLVYRRAARNFNPLMAMAADVVIVEAEEIVEAGCLDPDEVMTPGIFVDLIIKG